MNTYIKLPSKLLRKAHVIQRCIVLVCILVLLLVESKGKMSSGLELPFANKFLFGYGFSILRNNGLNFLSDLEMKS